MKENVQEDPIKTSGELWRLLSAPAGLENAFYDRDLLYGNDAVDGLYKTLGIKESAADFADELDRHDISVEKLVMAFFQTLQPYAKMMSDMCAFFQRHLIDQTDRSLTIEFDFGKEEGKLEFDLEHFRIQLEQYNKVQANASYPVLGCKQLWRLAHIIIPDWSRLGDHPTIRGWLEDYERGEMRTMPFPSSGHQQLDQQLEILNGIWASFINTAVEASITPNNYGKVIERIRAEKSKVEPFGWDLEAMALSISDGWPRTFLNCIHLRLDMICSRQESEAAEEAALLAEAISAFWDEHLTKKQDQQDVVEELQDLLRMPFWNQRHALYSVWILQLMDRLLDGYPDYKVNHTDGKLSIPFKAVKLASFSTIKNTVELWSEMRLPVENPRGKGRTENIQPDYTFFNQDTSYVGPAAENAVAVVEVKQYEKPGSGFPAAMDDYRKGAFNAHIFLANYGIVRPKMRLKDPGSCTAIGQVLPDSEPSLFFLSELKKKLPAAAFPLELESRLNWSEEQWMLLHEDYDAVYVDISGSLEKEEYRDFLRIALNWMLYGKGIKKLAAVDKEERRSWALADASDIEELLALSFYDTTDFRKFLSEEKILLITDHWGAKGVQDLEGAKISCIITYKPYPENIQIRNIPPAD